MQTQTTHSVVSTMQLTRIFFASYCSYSLISIAPNCCIQATEQSYQNTAILRRFHEMTLTSRMPGERTTQLTLLMAASIMIFLVSSITHHGHVDAFVPVLVVTKRTTTRNPTTFVLHDKRWDRDIEERSRSKAGSSGGTGGTVAGALLGGLVAGPFGALFGASIGSNLGARNAMDRAKREEMERMGLTQDMIDTANDVGLALERSNEGLKAVQESLETQQRFARRLDADVTDLYERAQKAIADSDEDLARKLLLQRTEVQEKLKKALMNCAEEKKRLGKMTENVAQLKRRALEVESLMSRSVSSSALKDSSTNLSLPVEDPLLKKFKDLGID